jgi:hypothetical protein
MKTEHQFRVQEQIRIRRPLLHGRGANLIKVGTILAFSPDGQKAIVTFPADQTRLTVPLDQLEPVSKAYGRARVQVNPVNRGIAGRLW